ncbi:MAG: nitronate monooxygenase [Bacteroidales bacterium]
MKSNQLTEILGIKYPIIQGSMARIADARLASSVSNAGGLGVITCIMNDANSVRDEIRKCKKLTDKPFGVNIMLMHPLVEDVAHICVDEKVPIIVTSAGNPMRFMKTWKDAGIKIISVIPNSKVAKKMEDMGADVIVAEGEESGGHIGEIGTISLIPNVVDAVKLPVVAAGGISDGRGLAAALMLGAQGVQLGTRFLCAKECNINENYKNKIISAKEYDTLVAGRRFGHAVRSLKSPFQISQAHLERESDTTEDSYLKYSNGALKRALEGNENEGSFMAGQSAGLIKNILPVSDIIDNIMQDAKCTILKNKLWIEE